ncbi:MAG: hypothetical protein IPN96_23635 [Anaerolineales bacterium]|nr:hypothetical protein [Anaerolineales bacterium]
MPSAPGQHTLVVLWRYTAVCQMETTSALIESNKASIRRRGPSHRNTFNGQEDRRDMVAMVSKARF